MDPFYLTWKARSVGMHSHFIERAGEINIQVHPVSCLVVFRFFKRAIRVRMHVRQSREQGRGGLVAQFFCSNSFTSLLYAYMLHAYMLHVYMLHAYMLHAYMLHAYSHTITWRITYRHLAGVRPPDMP